MAIVVSDGLDRALITSGDKNRSYIELEETRENSENENDDAEESSHGRHNVQLGQSTHGNPLPRLGLLVTP